MAAMPKLCSDMNEENKALTRKEILISNRPTRCIIARVYMKRKILVIVNLIDLLDLNLPR